MADSGETINVMTWDGGGIFLGGSQTSGWRRGSQEQKRVQIFPWVKGDRQCVKIGPVARRRKLGGHKQGCPKRGSLAPPMGMNRAGEAFTQKKKKKHREGLDWDIEIDFEKAKKKERFISLEKRKRDKLRPGLLAICCTGGAKGEKVMLQK